MEIRIIAENMRNLAGKLEGAGMISGAAAALPVISLLRGRRRKRGGEGRFPGNLLRTVLFIFAAGFISCQGLWEPVYAQNLSGGPEEVIQRIRIDWETPPDLDKDGVWYYRQAAAVCISKVPETEKPEDGQQGGGQEGKAPEEGQQGSQEERPSEEIQQAGKDREENLQEGGRQAGEGQEEKPPEEIQQAGKDQEGKPSEGEQEKGESQGEKPSEGEQEKGGSLEEKPSEGENQEGKPSEGEPEGGEKGETGQPPEESERWYYRICEKRPDGIWAEITKEEWEERGIVMTGNAETDGPKLSLRFDRDIHCKMIAGMEGGEEKEQEIVVDRTAPQIGTEYVCRQDTGELLKTEPGSGQRPDEYRYYSGVPLKAGVQVTDGEDIVSVSCVGTAGREGLESFRRDAVREGESYTVNVPEGFKGFLSWTGEDILGNRTRWEQPGGFLCETERLHEENSNIRLEAVDGPTEPGYCTEELAVRILGRDDWSGIRKMTVRRDGQIVLEENLDGKVYSWEKLMVLPVSGMSVFVEADMEDMAGYHQRTSGAWISDKTAPKLHLSWEGQKAGNYFSGPGAVDITVEEEHFRPELWQAVWEAEPGESRISRWEQIGDTSYRCRAEFQEDGKYILKIKGRDPAGNALAGEDGVRIISWVVDSRPPKIEIQGVQDGGQYRTDTVLRIRIGDEWLHREKSQYLLIGDMHGEVALKEDGEGWMSWRSPDSQAWDDRYHLKVRGEDMAGNCTEQRMDFLINRMGSRYELEGLKNGDNLSGISRMIIREINLSPIQKSTVLYNWEGEIKILEKDKDYTVKEKKDGSYLVWEYRLKPSEFVREGNYNLTILSEDQAGNRMSNLKNKGDIFPIAFTVDRTPPSILINGVEDGHVYREGKRETEILVLENMNLKSLRIWKNGRELEVPFQGGVLEPVLIEYGPRKGWQTLRVEAEDQAGNQWKQETRTFYLGEPEKNGDNGETSFEEKPMMKTGKKETQKQSPKTGIWLIFCLASYIPLCYNLKVAKNTHADSEKVPVLTGLEKNKKHGED